MPKISEFLGIIIYMYNREHPPPHFHVEYGEYKAVIDIRSLELTHGSLPRRVLSLVLEWAHLHRKELEENWERIENKKALKAIKPLDET